MDVLMNLLKSFDLNEVFSSVQGFLGSGYLGLAVIALIIYSLVKQFMKLLCFGIIAGCIWFAISSGMADPLFRALGL